MYTHPEHIFTCVSRFPVCCFVFSSSGEGHGNPLQCSCLENPVDRGAWWAAVHGVAQSRTGLKRLSGSSSLFLREAPHLPPTQTARLQSPLGPGLLWVLSAEQTSCGGAHSRRGLCYTRCCACQGSSQPIPTTPVSLCSTSASPSRPCTEARSCRWSADSDTLRAV